MTAEQAKQALKEGKKVRIKDSDYGYFRLTSTGELCDEIAVLYDYDASFENLKYVEWEIVNE